jgi:hypothetical protein
MRKFGAIAIVLAVTALTANAGVITTFEPAGSVNIGGTDYNKFSMFVEVTTDWTNSILNVELSVGSLFQSPPPFGGNAEGNPGFHGFDPNLVHDTYATVPLGWAGDPATLDIGFTPGSGMDADSITIGWYESSAVNVGPGKFRVAQITLSADAEGTIGGFSYNAMPGSSELDKGAIEGYSIAGGQIIPEPATLALLSIGGIGMMIKRRK